MGLLYWLISLSPWAIIVVAILARKWIFAKIEKGVQHGFDKKLEALRSELRQNEEQLKSDLQERQVELTALRDAVLGGRAHRQSLLTKRQLEAVERVWVAVNSYAQFKLISTMMATINFDEAAKRAPHNPNMRQFFEAILGPFADAEKVPENPALNERPFVTPLAWAYLSAYQTILSGAFVRAKILQIGVHEAEKLIDEEPGKQIIKAALPEMAEIIDKYGSRAYHQFLDLIEERLLAELRKMLDGDEIDRAGIDQAKAIMKAIGEAEGQKQKAEQALKQGDGDKADPTKLMSSPPE